MQSLLLKLSGEALGGEAGFGIDPSVVERMCADIRDLVATGVHLAIVLGGGNLFRGQLLAQRGMDRVAGDRMGMLATVMNGLAMSDFLHQAGVSNQLFSAASIAGVVQGYEQNRVRDVMHDGQVVVLAGGTGNPFFTTDTAACLRGIELSVDAIVKATNVDGVYTADPRQDPAATKYDVISYDEVLSQELGVMDLTAIVLCKEHNMPLVVCDAHTSGTLLQVARGDAVGTRVVPSS